MRGEGERAGPGRPREVEGGAQYQVYLTEELVAAIDGIRGPTSRSAWVRRAIAEKLERDAEAEGPGS